MAVGLTHAEMVERVRRLEEQVKALYAHLGLPFDDPAAAVSPRVLEILRSGDRMRAAVEHARETGCDFVAAQRIVNAI